MTASELIQVILTGVLVIITGLYVWRTFVISRSAGRQSNASVKMAEEMKEQRYDAVRPVIDFERTAEGEELMREGLAAKSEEFSYGVWCILRNIGVGPAIDVYSFNSIVKTPEGKPLLWYFGTIATEKPTDRNRLSIEQKGDRRFLVAYYRDVYGRCFESSREVTADKERHAWNIGPLEIRKITNEEFPK